MSNDNSDELEEVEITFDDEAELEQTEKAKSSSKDVKDTKDKDEIIKELKKENKELKKQIERLELENQANLKNQQKVLSAQADRMRLSNEIRFYRKFLEIFDNFERAFTSLKEEDHSVKGFNLIYKQMKQLIENSGIKKVESLGKPFDPNKHEAVAIVESNDHPDDTVIDVIKPCFVRHDGKVIRAAQVIVSKKSSKETKTETEQKTADTDNKQSN